MHGYLLALASGVYMQQDASSNTEFEGNEGLQRVDALY